MNCLEEYYNSYDEEGRLLSRHGQVEYLTTMKYIRECLGDKFRLQFHLFFRVGFRSIQVRSY